MGLRGTLEDENVGNGRTPGWSAAVSAAPRSAAGGMRPRRPRSTTPHSRRSDRGFSGRFNSHSQIQQTSPSLRSLGPGASVGRQAASAPGGLHQRSTAPAEAAGDEAMMQMKQPVSA